MINTDDVLSFVRVNEGRRFYTIAHQRPFTIHTQKEGIRFEIPAGSSWLLKQNSLNRYLDVFNSLSPVTRRKTVSYPDTHHERSYAVALLNLVADPKPPQTSGDGLNDLGDPPAGSASPDRAMKAVLSVERDARVRNYVLKVAAGKCEYCGQEGFSMPDGGRYLEAHHIIFLHMEGKDTPDNVIALCASHHREAHFGKGAEALEKEFLACIKKRQTSLKAKI